MGERLLRGLPASPGEAAGHARVLDPAVAVAPLVAEAERPAALEAARAALAAAGAELDVLAARLRDDGREAAAEIVETGVLMAADPALDAALEAAVLTDSRPPAAALVQACGVHADAIAALPDPMLAARADDVRSLGRRAARKLAGATAAADARGGASPTGAAAGGAAAGGAAAGGGASAVGAPTVGGEPFDARQPLIREHTLTAVVFVFVVVEFFFWYNVFGADIQPGAAWTDPTRISDLLLAALVPVSGIIAARVVGALGHRLVGGYPSLGRSVRIGSLCAIVLAGLSLTAVYLLVHARFDASTRPLGATPLPAVAMTLVFVVVLLGDMLARTFLLSEIRAQTRAWHSHLDRLLARAAAANDTHAQAWTRLRTRVQVRLDRCERVVAAGARIIGDQRATAGGWPPELPNLIWVHRPAHEPAGDAPADPPAVPCADQLQLYGAPLVLGPLRSVADAIDTLRHWPPYDQRSLGGYLDGMATRLYRLSAVPAADASAP